MINNHFNYISANLDKTALFVIDAQKNFCDPETIRGNDNTKIVAERIKSMVPRFRKLSIPVYAIYHTKYDHEKPEFYKFKPLKSDILIHKSENSVFSVNNETLNNSLKEKGIKIILGCGFNKSTCVTDTLIDATNMGFSTFLLEDLSGNDNNNPEKYEPIWTSLMLKKGVIFEDSERLIKNIKLYKKMEKYIHKNPRLFNQINV